MHTRASNSELVEPLPEPERTLNRRLCRQNRRVPYDQRNNPPQHPRIVYSIILYINYFRHFLDILRNYDPMDDEPMWAADRVVALTPVPRSLFLKLKILHSIEGTILEEEIFSEFDKSIAMAENENYDSKSDEEEPKFKKITINTDYKIMTSLEEPPTNLELKPLPDNLEYVFLEEPSFLPVIISSQLSTQNESKLIQLLDDKKPVVQKQRRLNPNMQEVVKKEIVKLLDTSIIYPITDSPWVSPIHCVPKKGGITVVINKNDELVPTRTVTVEVFMDDFSVFGNSFDKCVTNLDKMLQCCKDAHQSLWEKYLNAAGEIVNVAELHELASSHSQTPKPVKTLVFTRQEPMSGMTENSK
ncbi:hypothetical protein Tco_0990461 [Tanacetum coccineum]|uniref:Reverse transcriptase domain-containing protein n=1 Tax=Tanacetum coccineum TaxID=301880 RepID=A0ABQ5EY64_9ASTR